jgi:branched chain amino acid efflux pump
MTAWIAIAGLTLATVAIKAGSVLVAGGRVNGRMLRVIEALAPSLLGALVVAETVGGSDGGLSGDARLAGLTAAAAVLSLRGSLTLVVVAAAAATAAAHAVA